MINSKQLTKPIRASILASQRARCWAVLSWQSGKARTRAQTEIPEVARSLTVVLLKARQLVMRLPREARKTKIIRVSKSQRPTWRKMIQALATLGSLLLPHQVVTDLQHMLAEREQAARTRLVTQERRDIITLCRWQTWQAHGTRSEASVESLQTNSRNTAT